MELVPKEKSLLASREQSTRYHQVAFELELGIGRTNISSLGSTLPGSPSLIHLDCSFIGLLLSSPFSFVGYWVLSASVGLEISYHSSFSCWLLGASCFNRVGDSFL